MNSLNFSQSTGDENATDASDNMIEEKKFLEKFNSIETLTAKTDFITVLR